MRQSSSARSAVPVDPDKVAGIVIPILEREEFWELTIARLGRYPTEAEVVKLVEMVVWETVRQLLAPDAPTTRVQ